MRLLALVPLLILPLLAVGCSQDQGRYRVPASKAPWMVLLVGPMAQGEEYICSGTVIRPRWILTASHCVEQARPIVIGRNGQVVRAKQSFEHPSAIDANWLESVNPLDKSPIDLALVELRKPLVAARSLPLPRPDEAMPSSGTLWGYGPELSPAGRLYWTESRLKRCRQGGISLICLGDTQGRFRACQGDSGGPVVAGARRAVWGVNSFALIIPINGCTPRAPESFYASDVQRNLAWIESIIGR